MAQNKKTNLIGEVNTIALAVDGSSYCDGAVQEAIFFAQSCGAKLVVISVIGIESEAATSAHSASSSVRVEINDYLDKIKKMAADNKIKCKMIVKESYQPDKTIVELAYKHKADVIIMGRHGRKGLLKLLVGSMTSKVIGHGFPQVLVVPENFSISGEKILLALDGSKLSKMATKEAISMSLQCSTLKEIYVVSVATAKFRLAEAKDLVKTVCKKMVKRGIDIPCYPVAKVGRPSDIITKTAKKKKVDMIIVGGHGTGLSKLLMGHVTEKVIGQAHCAVLVIEKKR